jgi:signal transduction histidine kinase
MWGLRDMVHRDGSGRSLASVGGLGTWEGVRPTEWVRAGTGIGAVAYLGHVIACLASGSAPIGEPISEVVTFLVCAAAFFLAPRRPALAAGTACAVVAIQVQIASVAVPAEWVVAPPVLPVVILATGLFFGARAALLAALGAVVANPIVHLAAGRIGPAAGGVPPLELSRMVTTEFSVAATGLLTWLALRAFARLQAEAEEQRRLEARLQNAQRLQVVGELAGVAAHDFRNVLGAVQNAASLLSASKDPAVLELGRELLQCARSGQGITTRLLTLARTAEARRDVIDVAHAVEEVRPLVSRLVGPRCTLAMDAAGPAAAVVDPSEIEQVVLNLAANARDAMGRGGTVSVRVRGVGKPEADELGSTLAASRQVLVEVADQGEGVSPSVRDRLFEPFVTTKPRGEGTGLGLATVRSNAVASGGAVALESAPGAGATFRVFFPEAISSAVAPAPAR